MVDSRAKGPLSSGSHCCLMMPIRMVGFFVKSDDECARMIGRIRMVKTIIVIFLLNSFTPLVGIPRYLWEQIGKIVFL